MNNFMLGSFGGGFTVLLIVWSLLWKGLALWHSGRKGHPVWFVVFLLISTIGIVEIFYLFYILKLKSHQLFMK